MFNPAYNADLRVQTKKTGQVARMQLSVTRTLLLAAVASVIMLSKPVPVTGSAAAGPAGSGTGRLGVTRFVCAHCTSTGELSHRGMFLNRASVRRHIAASKPCRDARMGIREILLEARAGDVMAGGGGAAGPAPDVRHQPAGDVQAEIRYNRHIPYKHCQSINTRGLVV